MGAESCNHLRNHVPLTSEAGHSVGGFITSNLAGVKGGLDCACGNWIIVAGVALLYGVL